LLRIFIVPNEKSIEVIKVFLQIHFVTSYHASLLNRDDAGLAKRIRFGGSERIRVSSQAQKRRWTEWIRTQTDLPTALRSRYFFSEELKPRLVELGIDEEQAHDLIFHLANGVLTAAGGKDALDKKTLAMSQPILLGRPEADFFVELILKANQQGDEKKAKAFIDDSLKEAKNNFRALLWQSGILNPFVGIEGALFGRFVTSDVLTRIDAPVHVAHTFTTHAIDTEVDFFTVVDDLLPEGETGAAHVGDMELGAGIFYGYVVVDIPLLMSNLTGCEAEQWRNQNPHDAHILLELLIQAITQVTPGAKLGSTAPHARADFVMLEVGQAQPRSLANAYLDPINQNLHGQHPMEQSIARIAEYLDGLEYMYGDTEEIRFVSSMHPWAREEQVTPLKECVAGALDVLFAAGGGQS
jgi:CRISPR system Cascade subunit CasC